VRGPGEILVVSCYELGRQPVAAASAIAALEREGFSPAAQDVSVEKLSDEALSRAKLVLISVPMHTALQLGVRVAARARAKGARDIIRHSGSLRFCPCNVDSTFAALALFA